MTKKWMINKSVLVIMVSLIFLSFQSTPLSELTPNDKPNSKEVSNNAAVFKNKLDTAPTNDSVLSHFESTTNDIYQKFAFHKWNKLRYSVFMEAYKGYTIMKSEGMISNARYLTVIDFELSANIRRLWVLDMVKYKLVLHELVSHGRNSGEEYATSFSNQPESFKSSLGFYVTGMNYMGKNDYSLRLHGVEEGFNDNAFERGIVMHGAEYVCNKYICYNKRLGRSQGCPAVPQKVNKWLINTIENGSCMYMYYPDSKYHKKSEILNASLPSDFNNSI